jgi:hypothetical protein
MLCDTWLDTLLDIAQRAIDIRSYAAGAGAGFCGWSWRTLGGTNHDWVEDLFVAREFNSLYMCMTRLHTFNGTPMRPSNSTSTT